jgi:hypothetical protein
MCQSVNIEISSSGNTGWPLKMKQYGVYSMDTIMCSQRTVNALYNLIDEPTIADAILDNILDSAYRIELKRKLLRTTQ